MKVGKIKAKNVTGKVCYYSVKTRLQNNDNDFPKNLSNSLKHTPDKGKFFFDLLTVCQHPDLFLHAARIYI